MTITEQTLDLAFPDVPGFKGQGWSTQETAMVVYWLLGNPDAWGQAMTVAREYPDNLHTVADTLHEKIVPRSELEAIASAGGDPARVNWLEVAHELIERRDDPRPAQEHAGSITAQALDLAAAVTVDPEAMKDPGLPVPDDPTAIAIYTAHRVDRTLYELTHSVQRMQAAGKASGDLRTYHAENMARHVQNALDSGHSLKENLQEHYPAEAAELAEVKGTLGLAVAVSTDAKIATTSHLLASVLNELTHGSRHVKAMLTDDPDSKEWEFDAQHCARHLDGAVEHIGKLRQHYIDNYPPEGKWLTGLRAIAEAAGETPGPQHATENKAVISAQFTGETITGQLDLAGRGRGSPKASPARWPGTR